MVINAPDAPYPAETFKAGLVPCHQPDLGRKEIKPGTGPDLLLASRWPMSLSRSAQQREFRQDH
jgi:hypothetical protein